MSRTTARSDGSGSSEPSSSTSCNTGVASNVDGNNRVQMSARSFMTAFFRPEVIDPQRTSTEASRFSSSLRAMKRPSFGMGSACNLLNLMSTACQEACPDKEQIVFVDHSGAFLSHHPDVYNNTQPHIIAVPAPVSNSWYADGQRRRTRASVKDKNPPNRSAVAWHHVLSTIFVNKSIDNRYPVDLAIDCIGALNQARPDLPGCFGLRMTRLSYRILWSDAAALYSTPEIAWDDPETVHIFLGYVDRLYNPIAVDSSIRLAPVRPARAARLHCDGPIWLIGDDNGGVYRADQVLSAGRPWSRKSWVVRATRYKHPDSHTFADCPPAIIKDSYPTLDEVDYSESAILGHIHAEGAFPGVSRVIARFAVSSQGSYVRSIDVPSSGTPQRHKYRLILDGSGKDLYRCRSILQFLMIMYDTIEVLRHLHQTLGVLHQDISLRNILCNSTQNRPLQDGPHHFIRQILAAKYPETAQDDYNPTCMLIDFDNSSCESISPESMRLGITGTAPFISSVISSNFQKEQALPPGLIRRLTGNAKDCYVHVHGQDRYDKLSTMHNGLTPLPRYTPIPPEQAVHGPRHDVESCCWLMMHFLLTSRPTGGKAVDKLISSGQRICNILEEHQIGTTPDSRISIVKLRGDDWARCIHPSLASLGPFLGSLSILLDTVYELLAPSPDPYHLHEAVQRLLLQEICRLLDAGDDIAVDTCRRRLWSVFNLPFPSQLRNAKRRHQHELPPTDPHLRPRRRQRF